LVSMPCASPPFCCADGTPCMRACHRWGERKSLGMSRGLVANVRILYMGSRSRLAASCKHSLAGHAPRGPWLPLVERCVGKTDRERATSLVGWPLTNPGFSSRTRFVMTLEPVLLCCHVLKILGQVVCHSIGEGRLPMCAICEDWGMVMRPSI